MEGKKIDQQKVRLDLVPPELIEAVGWVTTFGATKYGDHNWRQGIKYSRIIAAAMRHLNEYRAGNAIDADSGLHHLWHAATNIAFLIAYEADEKYHELNDLFWNKVHKVQEVSE